MKHEAPAFSIEERAGAWLSQRLLDDGAPVPVADFVHFIPAIIERFRLAPPQAADACALALEYRLWSERGVDIAANISGSGE
ncbi:hypothetical protein FHX10_004557 [Rhizobium sp. BK591]|uniref:hypothetical protein n=1 Tax=Rhizobium sp. BK591 TaxID=2586985 RepID=UPI00160BE5B5|nr:hypothetical protein [Rhizobium sp. BK591]MBB3745020.1 hypothetical protein [Rhizobium sp. BK591]